MVDDNSFIGSPDGSHKVTMLKSEYLNEVTGGLEAFNLGLVHNLWYIL